MSRPPNKNTIVQQEKENKANDDFSPEAIEKQIAAFKARGGRIYECEIGESAYENNGSGRSKEVIHTQLCGFQPNSEESLARMQDSQSKKHARKWMKEKGAYSENGKG